ncbi:MAG TPA: hypothetical protein VIV60_19975, partial [Polyangiaceae bacterium]
MRTLLLLALGIAMPVSLVACESSSGQNSDPQNTNPQNTNPQNTNPQNTNPQNAEPQSSDVVVTWSDVKQIMDGFGASSAFFGNTISDETADLLFDAKKGIGLSLLRTMIGTPDDTKSDGSEPTENPKPIATA